ncbi:MAG: response regulator [Pseudomonadales bacterium]|nr:response regulator [Pseudomonadales bacterium]
MNKILIVDDDHVMVKYHSSLLNELGYSQNYVQKSTQVMAYLEKNDIDLILLDLYMPDIDGMTLLKSIKKHARLKSIEVIMISAINDDDVIAESLKHGAFDFLRKPVNETILSNKVQAALDKTRIQLAQQELQRANAINNQSIAHYDAIINTSSDGIISINEQGLITSFNPGAEKLFGYHAGDLIDKNISVLMPQPFKDELDGYLHHYLTTGIKTVIGQKIEVEAQRKDGTLFPIELSVNEINYEGFRGFSGIIRNISDRVQYRKSIIKINEYLDTVLLNLPVGVAILEGDDFRYFRINQYLADINGMSIDDHLGKTLLEVLPHAAEMIIPELKNVMSTGQPILNREFSILLPGRSDAMTLIDWHVPICGDDGKPNAIISVVLDISELRSTQDRLQQSQKLEALGTLAGGIAHDFNNTLAITMGTAELLLEILPEDYHEKIRRIISASDKAANLVKQILAFSRTDSSELSPQNLNEIVAEAILMIRPIIPTNIHIQQQLLSNCPNIMADKNKVEQIIINLCTNAYHAMEQTGGSIDICVQREEGQIVLMIKDSGPGIALAEQERIFDPFYTTKEMGKGTGLGLSIVYSLVKQHHADISLESAPQQGCTFFITFPITEQSLAQETIIERTSVAANGHILVVDDEQHITDLFKDFLQPLGYKITICHDGAEAYEVFRQSPQTFDLLLTDQAMPQLTGLELVQKIHLIDAELPVILLSGYNEMSAGSDLKELAISRYLHKPVKLQTLLHSITDVLSERIKKP